jgi:RNA polymerase subunit RPABC4/transcription elongation factor Spt4
MNNERFCPECATLFSKDLKRCPDCGFCGSDLTFEKVAKKLNLVVGKERKNENTD